MNESIQMANKFLLFIEGLAVPICIFLFLGALFLFRSKIIQENLKNTSLFGSLLFNDGKFLNFTSKKIKLINAFTFFLPTILSSLFNFSFWLSMIFLRRELIFNAYEKVRDNLFWEHFLFFGIIFSLYYLLIVISLVYFFIKKYQFETTDQNLISEFNNYKKSLIQTGNYKKETIIFNFQNKIKNNLYHQKYNYFFSKFLEQLKRKKHRKNYEFYVIDYFRSYLTSMRRDFNLLLENVQIINGVYNDDINFSQELKMVLIINFFVSLDTFESN